MTTEPRDWWCPKCGQHQHTDLPIIGRPVCQGPRHIGGKPVLMVERIDDPDQGVLL